MDRLLQLWFRLVPAFAAGYFLSYGLRTVNAVIAPELMRDLGIGASGLGLLTSAYFLGFGLFQIPLGLLLDRWGRAGSKLHCCWWRRWVARFSRSARTCKPWPWACPHRPGRVGLPDGQLQGVQPVVSRRAHALASATIMVAGGLGAVVRQRAGGGGPAVVGLAGRICHCGGVTGGGGGLVMTTLSNVRTAPAKACCNNCAVWGASTATASFGALHRRAHWSWVVHGHAGAVGRALAHGGQPCQPRHCGRGVAGHGHRAQLGGFAGGGGLGLAGAARTGAPMRLLSAGMGLALVVEVAILRQWAAPLLLWPLLGLSFSLGNIAYSQLRRRLR